MGLFGIAAQVEGAMKCHIPTVGRSDEASAGVGVNSAVGEQCADDHTVCAGPDGSLDIGFHACNFGRSVEKVTAAGTYEHMDQQSVDSESFGQETERRGDASFGKCGAKLYACGTACGCCLHAVKVASAYFENVFVHRSSYLAAVVSSII